MLHMICVKCGDVDKFHVSHDEGIPLRFCTRCGTKFEIVETVNGKAFKHSPDIQAKISEAKKPGE